MIDKTRNYFLLFIIVVALYILFLLIKPFLSAIFASIILTYALYPLYLFLNKRIKKESISAFIMVLIVVLLIIIPFAFAANIVSKEAISGYNYFRSRDFSLLVSQYFQDNSGDLFKTFVDKVSFALVKFTSEFLLSLPTILLNFFVMAFLTYYLFKEWDKFVGAFKKLIPLKDSVKNKLYEKFEVTTNGLIYGILLAAIVQGVLAGIGYYIFNIPSPILLGFVTMIASLIPLIGTGFIWVPAGIIQLLQGNLFSGIGILVYCALIVSTMDNIIKPKFISRKAKIHPAIVLIGLVGGLKVFGFMGIFIGPLFLTLIMEAFSMRGEISEISSS